MGSDGAGAQHGAPLHDLATECPFQRIGLWSHGRSMARLYTILEFGWHAVRGHPYTHWWLVVRCDRVVDKQRRYEQLGNGPLGVELEVVDHVFAHFLHLIDERICQSSKEAHGFRTG